ncbi:MFS transporter [Rathayibacter soli]|uniref:MFS transporter n=1 Tax=Rathayibacter soli TaxID=3144168 RepID=UPI0027E43097|nr:MFS transporter [Glaciibacter superstes]
MGNIKAMFLVEPARPAAIRRLPNARWLAVGTVCVGAFMGQLDASIVTVALPDMHRSLGVSLGAVAWVALIYLLVLVGMVAAIGRIADMVGRKLLYLYGFAIFTAASVGCGLSTTLWLLLAMRVLQAVGAAMLQANSVALIRTNVRRTELRRAIGIQGAAQALGLALGPAVGGVLIGLGGWQWIFWINLPAGILGLAMGWFLLPRTRARAPRVPLDWFGLLTLLPASAAILLAFSVFGQGDQLPLAIGLGVAGVALGWIFLRLQRSREHPLVDLSLFARWGFSAGILSSVLSYAVLFGLLFITPIMLETQFGATPAAAGLQLAVLPLFLGVTAPAAAFLASRVSTHVVTSVGMTVTALGIVPLVFSAGSRPMVVIGLAVIGVGLGIFTPANNAAVAGAGADEQAGMVSGVLNMTRGLGTAFGVAAASTVYSFAGAASTGAVPTSATIALLLMFALAAAIVAVTGGRGSRRENA